MGVNVREASLLTDSRQTSPVFRNFLKQSGGRAGAMPKCPK